MSDFYVGQKFNHPEYGTGQVTFVGKDYVGIEVDDGRHALIKKEAFSYKQSIADQTELPDSIPLSWLESTFVYEGDDIQHYLGSHWTAFVDDSKTIFEKLPVILQKSEPWIGGVNREALRHLPDHWPRGVVLAWPNHRQGLMMVVGIGDQNELASLYPFVTDGGQHTLTIRRINVWAGRLEAQIEAELGDTIITFFDIAYAKHRLWYEAGKDYEFILVGMAYNAKPSEMMEIPVNYHPDQVAWQRFLAEKRGEQISDEPSVLSLRGMAMFMPVEGWDADEYKFRGTVTSVKEVQGEVLGQKGWFVRATVMRCGNDDADLDILLTKRVWREDKPPSVGQDIEGSLWLQGYLWDI